MMAMKYTRLIMLSVLVSLFSPSFAQDKAPVPENPLDKKYTPGNNTIFNIQGSKNPLRTSDVTVKNIIKFCPTMLLRQKVSFYYERQIIKGFAMQVGIDKAFGDDVFQRTFFGLKDYKSLDDVLNPDDLLKNAKFYGSWPGLTLSARYYFSGFSFDEAYMELAYQYEKMNYLVDPTVNAYRVEGSNTASFKMNAFSFGYGFMIMAGTKSNISHEFFINFGIKYFKYTQFDFVTVKNAVSNREVYRKSESLEQKEKLMPAINIGYRFGFGF